MQKINRRQFVQDLASVSFGILNGGTIISSCRRSKSSAKKRPNIFFAISDDQSWLHTGINGCKIVNTPTFDRIAREGVLFNNAFCAAPQCSPNRASILTGRHIWQNEEAGTHDSNFPNKLPVFPDLLEAAGYFVGFTGKPWGPGNWRISGWKRNPAGNEFNQFDFPLSATDGINKKDYAANFIAFLKQRPKDHPFCFWFGCFEPHRKYERGAGVMRRKKLEEVIIPGFLPEATEIRSDLLDYAVEIDWFDEQLGKMVSELKKIGELDNTIIVVTSDNGMPFPRAKANNYEYGIHLPLAVRWGDKAPGGRIIDDLISCVDFAPTFLEAAGITHLPEMTGKSFQNLLVSNKQGLVDSSRCHILSGRERHTHARPNNFGYPVRAIRTPDFLYIWNLKPDRWPAGDPINSDDAEGYYDIDASPTKSFLIKNRANPAVKKYFLLAVAKRPAEELYNIKTDPACLENLAARSEYHLITRQLRAELEKALIAQADPRIVGYGDIFESYPRYSSMRDFAGFKKQGEYNPEYRMVKK